MKKTTVLKSMSSVLVIAMMCAFTACGDANDAGAGVIADGYDDQAKEQMLEAVDHMDEPTKEALKSVPVSGTSSSATSGTASGTSSASSTESSTASSANTALEALVTSPSNCKKYGGYYVLRNGKNYATGGYVSYSQVKGSGIGAVDNIAIDQAKLYSGWNDGSAVSMGDVPILTVNDSDTLIRYDQTFCTLIPYDGTPITSIRYSVIKPYSDVLLAVFPEGKDMETYHVDHMQQAQIEDTTGRVCVADILNNPPSNLERGKEYILSFFIGMDYYEFPSVADSWYYPSPRSGDMIELQGTLVKGGYVTFDLSNVPAGLYRLAGSVNAGFIKVSHGE